MIFQHGEQVFLLDSYLGVACKSNGGDSLTMLGITEKNSDFGAVSKGQDHLGANTLVFMSGFSVEDFKICFMLNGKCGQ
jgi:hypothetical protein